MSDGTVIGVVWGAWRSLVTTWGDEAPSYAWCEREYKRDRPLGSWSRRFKPGDDPGWLSMELFWLWRKIGQPRAGEEDSMIWLWVESVGAWFGPYPVEEIHAQLDEKRALYPNRRDRVRCVTDTPHVRRRVEVDRARIQDTNNQEENDG